MKKKDSECIRTCLIGLIPQGRIKFLIQIVRSGRPVDATCTYKHRLTYLEKKISNILIKWKGFIPILTSTVCSRDEIVIAYSGRQLSTSQTHLYTLFLKICNWIWKQRLDYECTHEMKLFHTLFIMHMFDVLGLVTHTPHPSTSLTSLHLLVLTSNSQASLRVLPSLSSPPVTSSWGWSSP